MSSKNYEVKVWEEECEEPFCEESKTATKNNIDSHPLLYDKALQIQPSTPCNEERVWRSTKRVTMFKT